MGHSKGPVMPKLHGMRVISKWFVTLGWKYNTISYDIYCLNVTAIKIAGGWKKWMTGHVIALL